MTMGNSGLFSQPKDPIMSNLPGLGRGGIQSDPNMAFEEFLQKYRLPFQTQNMARTLLPKILNEYFLKSAQILEQPKYTPFAPSNGTVVGGQYEQSGMGDIPTFDRYLQQIGIHPLILQLLGGMNQIRPMSQPIRRGRL